MPDLSKFWALFHKAGVPETEVESVREEIEQEELDESEDDIDYADHTSNVDTDAEPDFSTSSAYLALVQENKQLRLDNAAIRAQQTEFAAKFAQQEASVQFTRDCVELDELARIPFARITPAEASDYKELAQSDPVAFAKILPILKKRDVLAQFSKPTGVARLKPGGSSAAEQISDLTSERIKATGESYVVAFKAVCTEHPDLAEAHNAKFSGGN